MGDTPCLRCCLAARFGVGDGSGTGYDLPLFTLLGALAICLMVVSLLIKLVTDARKQAERSGRAEESLQLERSFFVFLVGAVSFEALEAFSLFIPPSSSWGATLAHVMFSIRQGLLVVPICLMWAAAFRVRIIAGITVGLTVFLVFLIISLATETSTVARKNVLGQCFLCEHFLPLYFGVFVAFACYLPFLLILMALVGTKTGPRRASRPWILFLIIEKAISVLGLGLGLFGSEVSGDVGS